MTYKILQRLAWKDARSIVPFTIAIVLLIVGINLLLGFLFWSSDLGDTASERIGVGITSADADSNMARLSGESVPVESPFGLEDLLTNVLKKQTATVTITHLMGWIDAVLIERLSFAPSQSNTRLVRTAIRRFLVTFRPMELV